MRALVTGGGRGIGAGIARSLASDGWDVVVAARSGAQVRSVASEIGGRWVAVHNHEDAIGPSAKRDTEGEN